MKRFFTKFQLAVALILFGLSASAQFTTNNIKYWVGSGPDTAVFVVDFLDTLTVAGGFDTISSSYAWGFLFDATNNTTAADMLAAIDADDNNLSISATAFLNDITYDMQAGIAATPNYWGTWTKTSATTWMANGGINDTLSNGNWFGCSYTDFNPALAPKEPVAAKNPNLFTANDIQYWVGTGVDTSYLVIDFLDMGMVKSFTWGYLYNGFSTMEIMLTAIATSDVNLTVNMSGGFLNDIIYGTHKGIAATPNYWGTWEGSHLSTLHSSMGISSVLTNGKWYGCSYTDFNPAIMPERTAPAVKANLFSTSDINYWVGAGKDTAIFVVDFLANGSSYAWGYLFNDSTSGDSILAHITAADTKLSYTLFSGFLNDISYDTETGLGGNPNYWGTWSATNTGDWYGNMGLSTVIKNGEWFGCSYTDFNPAIRPTLPTAVANPTTSIATNFLTKQSIKYYPNPTNGIVNFSTKLNKIQVFGLLGNLVKTTINSNQIDLTELEPSVYLLKVENTNSTQIMKITKQ